ncbi:type IV pilus assembly protein PilM [Jatrophihabitans sp.]|uniref:type IV pilus assembly protein PilM n=1 Tax=Jatrophihabitans sp. TaxID=1932789 RepID=UPI0030C76327|nr:pilM [Jatrophihabitans sp.]
MVALAPIGLDIGSTSIRAVEVARTKDRPVINNFGQALLPPGAVEGGVVKDERAVSAALKQLWTSQGFSTRNVALGVTHQQVVVREIEVSNLPPKEMRQALPFQVRDVLPLPVDEAILDFYPLEEPGTNDTVIGLLIAAPKEAVSQLVRAVERAGLHVESVDLSVFAALRAAAHLDSDAEAVIDIGANGTNIVIHEGGVPRIVRSIPRGGTEITKLIASRLGMSAAEAEVLKCRVGLTRGEGLESAEVVEEALRPLLNELRSSLSYYATAAGAQPVARLALIGGAAQLPGLVEKLQTTLGVTTFLSDPLQRVSDSRRGGRHDVLGRFRSSAAVSIGLTLGAA